MNHILAAVATSKKMLLQYLATHQEDEQSLVGHFLKILDNVERLLNSSPFDLIRDYLLKGYQCSESDKNFTALKDVFEATLFKLFLGADADPSRSTIANDKVLRALEIINKTFAIIALGVKNEDAILFQPVKTQALTRVDEVRFNFQLIYHMRKHNIDNHILVDLWLLTLMSHDQLQVNKSLESSALGHIDNLMLIMQTLIEKDVPLHFFRFFDDPPNLIIRIVTFEDFAQKIALLQAAEKFPPEKIEGIKILLDKLQTKSMTCFKNNYAAVVKRVESEKALREKIQVLRSNFLMGINDHCKPFFASDENEQIKRLMIQVIERMEFVLGFYQHAEFPVKSTAFETIMIMRDDMISRELAILGQLMCNCVQQVFAKKHPVKQNFIETFARKLNSLDDAEYLKLIEKKIRLIFTPNETKALPGPGKRM